MDLPAWQFPIFRAFLLFVFTVPPRGQQHFPCRKPRCAGTGKNNLLLVASKRRRPASETSGIRPEREAERVFPRTHRNNSQSSRIQTDDYSRVLFAARVTHAQTSTTL